MSEADLLPPVGTMWDILILLKPFDGWDLYHWRIALHLAGGLVFAALHVRFKT